MSALMCPRCGREIRPGDAVDPIGITTDGGRRIFTGDELTIVHAECPAVDYCEGCEATDVPLNGRGYCPRCVAAADAAGHGDRVR